MFNFNQILFIDPKTGKATATYYYIVAATLCGDEAPT